MACGEPRIRGSFTSAGDLIAAIENFIHQWNDRCQPLHLDQDARRVNAALLPRQENLVHATLGNCQNYPAATDHAAGQPGSRCWVTVTRGTPA